MPLFVNKQKGLALIMVLLVFALVSMLAISMQKTQVMGIAQASATFNYTQAQLLALSAEDIAKAALKFDGQRDSKSGEWDTATEMWNTDFPPMTDLPDAEIYLAIRDLQGLFNLNSLAKKGIPGEAAQKRFERLLDGIGILNANAIAGQLNAWLDPNSSASSIYQNYTPPYMASGFELSHPSELLLLEDMTYKDFLIIEPYITALPMDTPLNINTTDKIILAAWDPGLDTNKAEALVNKSHAGACEPSGDRDANLFKSAEDFLQEPDISPLASKAASANAEWEEGDFDVKTSYFSVFIQVKVDGTEILLESILKRDNNDDFITSVYRNFTRKIEDVTARLKIIKC